MQTTVIKFSRAHENEVPINQKEMKLGRGELIGKEKGVSGRRERVQDDNGIENDKNTSCTRMRLSKVHKYFKHTQSTRGINAQQAISQTELEDTGQHWLAGSPEDE